MKGNGGSLVAFSCSGMGEYLYVEFDKNTLENIDESIIEEIYYIVKNHCEQEGVSEVTVVFMWGEMPIEGLAIDNESYVDESGDDNFSGNEEEIAGNEKTNKMLGFTSMMTILGLLSSLIFKRS